MTYGYNNALWPFNNVGPGFGASIVTPSVYDENYTQYEKLLAFRNSIDALTDMMNTADSAQQEFIDTVNSKLLELENVTIADFITQVNADYAAYIALINGEWDTTSADLESRTVAMETLITTFDQRITNLNTATDSSLATFITDGNTQTRAAMDIAYLRRSLMPVNLRDLGADNTGVADIMPMLNLAATFGRRIDVPPGTYRMESRFINTLPVEINCEPGAIFECAYDDAAVGVPNVNGMFYPQADFIMRGGVIDGKDTYGQFGIKISVPNVKMYGTLIRNTKHFGVYITTGADKTVFDGVTVGNCGDPINPTSGGFYNSSDGSVMWSNCVATNNYQQGWYNSGTGVTQLTNVSAVGNGSYGIDMRSPGSILNGFYISGNVAGLSVALKATNIPSSNISISNGTIINNGPTERTDAYEMSLSNTTRLIVSNVVVESNSLTNGIYMAGVVSAILSNMQVRGTHAAYATALQVKSFTLRCKQITLNGCTFENYGNLGTVLTVQDVDGFYVNGGKISGAPIGIRYFGRVTDTSINPDSWGNIYPYQRITDSSTTGSSQKKLAAAPTLGPLPTSGYWAQGEQVFNSAAAVGQPKGWVCTTTGGAVGSTWLASTAYTVGQWVGSTGPSVWECTVSGTSGTVVPTGALGDTVVDGTVTWIKRYTTTAVFVSTGTL